MLASENGFDGLRDRRCRPWSWCRARARRPTGTCAGEERAFLTGAKADSMSQVRLSEICATASTSGAFQTRGATMGRANESAVMESIQAEKMVEMSFS